MNARLLTGIAVGCAAGFAGGWFLHPSPSASDHETSGVRLAKLEAELKTKSAEVERLTKSAAKKSAPDKDPAEGRIVKSASADDPQFKQMQERMKRKMEEKQKLRLDERVAVLRKRLGLSDAQAATIRDLLQKYPSGPQDMMMRAMAGEASGEKMDEGKMMLEMLRPGQKTTELTAKISALLTPEQEQAYTTFRQEQRTNDVEVKANKELARLQTSLTLNPEQKDKAFGILSKLADEEYDNPVSPMASLMQQQMKAMSDSPGMKEMKPHMEEINSAAELATQRRQQRVAAMRDILTDEQLALYESQQKQGSMAEMLDGSFDDMGSLFMDVQDPEPTPAAPAPSKP